MISVLRERIQVGDYRIDPQQVATAMLARWDRAGGLATAWSEMLVAAQPVGGEPGESHALAGHDPA